MSDYEDEFDDKQDGTDAFIEDDQLARKLAEDPLKKLLAEDVDDEWTGPVSVFASAGDSKTEQHFDTPSDTSGALPPASALRSGQASALRSGRGRGHGQPRRVQDVTFKPAAYKCRVLVALDDDELKTGTMVHTKESKTMFVCEAVNFVPSGARVVCINATIRRNWGVSAGTMVDLITVRDTPTTVIKEILVDVRFECLASKHKHDEAQSFSLPDLQKNMHRIADNLPMADGQLLALAVDRDHIAWCTCRFRDTTLRGWSFLFGAETSVSFDRVSWALRSPVAGGTT